MPMPGTVTSNVDAPAEPRGVRLRQLAWLFLKLGTIAFGGPAAHIAMMEDEVVGRRQWLTRAEFLDYLGATNLIPGPNSTELALHIGHAMKRTMIAGERGSDAAPNAYLVEQSSHSEVAPHFHDNDQFQVVVRGSGSLMTRPRARFAGVF